MNRRSFFRKSCVQAAGIRLLGASLTAEGNTLRAETGARINLDPSTLEKFVDPLPIPLKAVPSGRREIGGRPGVKAPLYRTSMRQIQVRLHRDLPLTSVWSFGESWPGPTFDTTSGEGLYVEWRNELPVKHLFAVDHRLCGAEKTNPTVRTVVHVHGGRTPPESDGYPEGWFTPGKSATYYYPNQQEAATLFYHDHAMGITRLNTYPGLFGLYVVRDSTEAQLNLPKEEFEIPLILSDRNITREGELSYPVSGKPEEPWVPEVFGEAILVNGKLYPYLAVKPRRYRFRILNASNGRFYRLSLSNNQQWQQIGSDQGLLFAPTPAKRIALSPGERADLILDFRDHSGEQLVLKNDAFELMQFRVSKQNVDDPSSLPLTLRPIRRIPETDAVETRTLTLGEETNRVAEPMRILLNDIPWAMPVTEKPLLGFTEIWNLVNLTEDSHPVHLHMVRFQILDRRPFDVFTYMTEKKFRFFREAIPAGPEEAGGKTPSAQLQSQ